MQIEHKNDIINLQQLWQKRFEESAAQKKSFKEWFMEIFTNNFASSLRDGIVNDMNSQLQILECNREAVVSTQVQTLAAQIQVCQAQFVNMKESVFNDLKSQLQGQLQVIVDNQRKLTASQIQASDVQLKNFMVPLSQHIVFGISQRLLDIHTHISTSIRTFTNCR